MTGDVYHGWSDYVTFGGLPLVATMKTEQQKISYLTNLFTEVYLRKIRLNAIVLKDAGTGRSDPMYWHQPLAY